MRNLERQGILKYLYRYGKHEFKRQIYIFKLNIIFFCGNQKPRGNFSACPVMEPSWSLLWFSSRLLVSVLDRYHYHYHRL